MKVKVAASIPTKRVGKPEDIAQAVASHLVAHNPSSEKHTKLLSFLMGVEGKPPILPVPGQGTGGAAKYSNASGIFYN